MRTLEVGCSRFRGIWFYVFGLWCYGLCALRLGGVCDILRRDAGFVCFGYCALLVFIADWFSVF